MTLTAILLFAAWEASLFAAAMALAWRLGPKSSGVGDGDSETRWLVVLAIQLTLESSLAALFSFSRMNSRAAYWAAAVMCAAFALIVGRRAFATRAGTGDHPGGRAYEPIGRLHFALLAALAVPLICLSFHPVEEIDSINYLHYLIDWMGNRATPYTFATNYVAFWELSFLPTWMVTGVDVFFPLLALKSIVLLALAAWLVGRELGLRGPLLLWTVATSLTLRHFWFESSGVGTLKNDALHGAGFLLLMLAVLRAGRSPEGTVQVTDSAQAPDRGFMRLGGPQAPVHSPEEAFTEVGRTPWSAADALVGIRPKAGQGAVRGPGGPPHSAGPHANEHFLWALAFGAAFAAVKYTGIFLAALAVVGLALSGRLKRRDWPWLLGGLLLFLISSGHYYLRTLVQHGSPFYPFQINFGPIHLPGTADLSATSILYSLRDPRLWRALFWPAGGVSPAGLLFPLTLAAVLPLAAWRCAHAVWKWLRRRTPPGPLDWAAAWILCGWLLYFRSVFSASAQIAGGDLSFLLYGLNSIRYVDGVLAASDLWLVALAGRTIAWPLIAIQLASRLLILYPKLPAGLFPPAVVIATALLAATAVVALGRRAWWLAALAMLAGGPFLVERNRAHWTTYWNGLKPSLDNARSQGLAVLAMPDGGYFAAHVVAAGNPVDPAVRALAPEELDALPPAARPRYLAVMPAPGTDAAARWRELYGSRLAAWGYRPQAEIPMGGLFRR